MEAIQEAESADAPSAFSIPQAEVDRALQGYGGKLKIFDFYHQNLPARSIVAALRKEYGASGGSYILSDGSHIFLDYRPNTGMEFWNDPADKKFIVKWPAVEKRIRQLIQEGSYLSAAEMEQYLSSHLEAAPEQVAEATGPVITDMDVDKLLVEDWGITGRKQRIFALYQQGLSDEQIAGHLRAEYNKHGYTSEERAHEGPCVLADGGEGYGYFVAAEWRLRRRDVDGPMRYIKYEEMARHIRGLIDAGRYLTPEELAQYQSDHLEQLPALEITQADIDAQLRFEAPLHLQNLRIYEIYQQNMSVEDTVGAVSAAFGRVAAGHKLPDGTQGWVDYRPDVGITIRKNGEDKEVAEVTISWPDAEKRLRQLIEEGRYLTSEEMEQYRQTHPEQIQTETAPAPLREITQADIDAALQEWNGDLASKRQVQQYMTDHARDRGTAEWLKNEYGDGLPAFPVTVEGAATDLPWTKVQRHLARLVKEDRFFTEEELDNFEDIDAAAIRGHLEQDSPSEFVEQVMADVERLAGQDSGTAPTIRETYDHYKPIVRDLVLADVAYQNACKNSDRENAIIEGDAAVKRAALTITEPEFMRLYHDMPDFRYRLHREIVDETYATLTQPQQEQQTVPPHAMPDTTGYEEETPPWGTEIGDHSPWGKVQMSGQFADGVYEVSTARHGGIMIRETDAKELLSSETLAAGATEYGWCYYEEDEAASVVIRELLDRGIPAAPPFVRCEYSETHAFFQENKIYSVAEFDRLMKQADDRRVAGREAAIKKYGTEQRWIESKDPEFDEFFGYDKVSFVIVLPDGVRVWGRQDVGAGYGGLLDYLRQNEKYRDIVPILQQATEREQAAALPPDLSDRPITREGDTITIGSGDASHEVDITVSDEDWQTIQEVVGATGQPPHDPLAPPYKPGDMVYLNNTAFEITGIGLLDVELRDPALPIPLFRTESKENFERLLHLDTRNGRITSYLPADMSRVNDDFREVLTRHLLTDRDKGYISQWLRSGENNRGIAMRLSNAFASRAETVTLETGDIADYFTSTISMAVEIQDKFGTKLSLSWEAVAPILRALWLQKLDGFTYP